MTYVGPVNTIEIDLANRIASAFRGIVGNIAKSMVARRTARELSALSTRELDDLGISRASITSVANKAAFGL
ncbi:MAG: DUF1127 domain-containing protein [Paracoccaceae bacterium]